MTNLKHKVENLLTPLRRDMPSNHNIVWEGIYIAIYNQIGIVRSADDESVTVGPIGRTFQ